MFLKLGKGANRCFVPLDDRSMITILRVGVIMDPAESKIAEMGENDQ